jgi:Cys-tRNA(Pro)/Cys-tRNA(Cys) deacylase
MKKKYPTHLDETAILFERIAVSAGERGHQMLVPPDALAALLGAEYFELTK